jgi:hypothetical protein
MAALIATDTSSAAATAMMSMPAMTFEWQSLAHEATTATCSATNIQHTPRDN